MNPRKREPISLGPILAIVVVVWGSTLLVPVWLGSQETAGQFGDMFGAVNALFASVTTGLLIFTIWSDRKDAREEIGILRETLEIERKRADAEARPILTICRGPQTEAYAWRLHNQGGPVFVISMDLTSHQNSYEDSLNGLSDHQLPGNDYILVTDLDDFVGDHWVTIRYLQLANGSEGVAVFLLDPSRNENAKFSKQTGVFEYTGEDLV